MLQEHVDHVTKTSVCPQLVFEDGVTVDYTPGLSYEMESRLGCLDLQDVYDEKYMVAFRLDEADLAPSGE